MIMVCLRVHWIRVLGVGRYTDVWGLAGHLLWMLLLLVALLRMLLGVG
jgi:hypothetical protein